MNITKFKYASADYLKHLELIDSCRTLDCLVKVMGEPLGFDGIIVQNASPFSATSHIKHVYFAYNIPSPVVDYVKEHYSINLDPVAKFVLNRGYAIWLSDLMKEQEFIDSGYTDIIQTTLDLTGDGICIPIFYKHFWVYGVITFDRSKSECDEILLSQVHNLFHRISVRYIVLKDLLKKKVKLTERESGVMELISMGKTNSEIALILGIKSSTVASYVKNIYLKLDATDRVTATLKAFSYDLIS